ncbi:DUF222 domain-containing protein [Pseudarthrobacter sp. So.54]
METTEDFLPFRETVETAYQQTGLDLDHVLTLLQSMSSTAAGDAALLGFAGAADLARLVEDISRVVEYFQVIAAGAVDRARKETAAGGSAVTSWATGWSAEEAARGPAAQPADDGYRNSTEFLRASLRVSAAEVRRRLCLGASILPQAGITGQPVPPRHGELGAAVAAGSIASHSASLVTSALDRVRHRCTAEAVQRMEHALTRTAIEHDSDFLIRVARRWADALDQDGAEPAEEVLRQVQGAFVRRPRFGLQHVEIFATAEQFEQLLTVMNTATNPRTQSGPLGGTGQEAAEYGLDRRSRPQKHLDGLVGACSVALASGTLPSAGGLRPQVMVTIAYRDLLDELEGRTASTGGSFLFTGPVTASTVRKIACDADIIPVVLGGKSRILDVGRASRVFPPHVRKAITARDLGCAFPGCTIPASWCEAHHITYWSRGGTSGTENGTLLCSHHHHLVHKEKWTIQVSAGIPWFIPPPHVDPRREPRRNHYFRHSAYSVVG